jgi:hypothetical protein
MLVSNFVIKLAVIFVIGVVSIQFCSFDSQYVVEGSIVMGVLMKRKFTLQ